MHPELLDILRCPQSRELLRLQDPVFRNGQVHSGSLVSESERYLYPIKDFIPRFVPASNYADNFGMQWNRFRLTQLDSHSGHPISADRFWRATAWSPTDIAGRWVLDAGCGAGRFAEVALHAGAKLIAVDFSSAVEACFASLQHHPNLHVVQADIYALPFPEGFFPFVYSLGVLQHTPDVQRAFESLPPMVSEGGQLCVDYYWKRIRTMLHPKYVLRPITKRMPRERLFALLESRVPALLRTSQSLRRVPLFGRILQRLVPVADYSGIYPLSANQLQEWALLDTFDMLAPEFDNPQTVRAVRQWFEGAGFTGVQVLHEGHLVGRGFKPVAGGRVTRTDNARRRTAGTSNSEQAVLFSRSTVDRIS